MSDYEVNLVNDNMQEFYVRFKGPEDSIITSLTILAPFQGGVWKLHVELPDQYPYKSPSIGFMNKIFHPNIDELFGSLLSLLYVGVVPFAWIYPNPTDPLNGEAAALLMREPDAYNSKVKEYVVKYATKEAADGATEDSDDDDVSSMGSFSDEDTPGMEL
ncbi:hypothetical protein HDV02_001542 [Globomyces sp. JEL0801]|nr:hypothetical protein HDV02_001542 [Globomyces sp. JEL0801]